MAMPGLSNYGRRQQVSQPVGVKYGFNPTSGRYEMAGGAAAPPTPQPPESQQMPPTGLRSHLAPNHYGSFGDVADRRAQALPMRMPGNASNVENALSGTAPYGPSKLAPWTPSQTRMVLGPKSQGLPSNGRDIHGDWQQPLGGPAPKPSVDPYGGQLGLAPNRFRPNANGQAGGFTQGEKTPSGHATVGVNPLTGGMWLKGDGTGKPAQATPQSLAAAAERKDRHTLGLARMNGVPASSPNVMAAQQRQMKRLGMAKLDEAGIAHEQALLGSVRKKHAEVFEALLNPHLSFNERKRAEEQLKLLEGHIADRQGRLAFQAPSGRRGLPRTAPEATMPPNLGLPQPLYPGRFGGY